MNLNFRASNEIMSSRIQLLIYNVELIIQELNLKSWAVVICILFSVSILAEEKSKYLHQPSVYEITPINSPVKGSVGKFSLKLPAGFEVENVKVKLVNANDLKKDQKKFEDISVIGNELNVGVSKLPPGFYQLHVRFIDNKSKKEHVYKTKYHDFVKFIIDESMQVPMPDSSKNDETIAGIDSDNDGIRDDIQRWINEEFSSSMKTRLAVKQYAVLKQAELISSANKGQSIIAVKNSFHALDCLDSIVGHQNEIKIVSELKEKLLNTKDRLYANMQANQSFSGQIISPTVGEAASSECYFDSSTLPN